ncbi:MAG: hypothetical protein KAR22_08740 [Gammaproteobacteria bacterium]|nr:hypothetical protein [Gammaproteobacteria bacterium]
MARSQALESLQTLFTSQTVATLPQIQDALGAVSAMTAFRVLREVAYRRSYNHNSRYYAAFDASRFDPFGLWRFQDILFSIDGSLKATLLRMVCEAPAGLTQSELADRLGVRVHNPLLGLVRSRALVRETVGGAFLYVHPDPLRGAAQLEHRRRSAAPPGSPARSLAQGAVSDAAVIAVLLCLLHSPGSSVAEVARRLRAHAPPISRGEVQGVFTRYDLEALREKGGPSHY